MDGKDVYAICDGNVAYQIHFLEAIRRGWLAPFHYYGVYDETDYSQIRWLGSHYDEEQLAAAQLRTSQAERIYRAWQRHKQTRTFGFCSSIRQANFLASYFVEAGVPAIALHSGTVGMSLEEAVRRLAERSLGVIFTVDLFNEGVDIPAVDTLLFVRPTESLTVFTQQVGRGLRLSEQKSYCAVIDLIGNYRNADVKLQLLAEPMDGDGKKATAIPSAPAGCVLELETAVVNLLEELSRKRMPLRDRLHRAFLDLRNELGRVPTYLELHLHGREDSKGYAQTFGSYASFLSWAGCLTAEEQAVYEACEAWLRDVEKTAMAKSYKMVLLLYMLERDAERWTEPVTPREAAPFFHRYLMEKEYRKRIDFSDAESRRLWAYDEAAVGGLIARMPMTKWAGARGSMTRFEDGVFSLADAPAAEHRAIVQRWTRDICEYRLHVHFERREGR